jgi:hypothetical protein
MQPHVTDAKHESAPRRDDVGYFRCWSKIEVCAEGMHYMTQIILTLVLE